LSEGAKTFVYITFAKLSTWLAYNKSGHVLAIDVTIPSLRWQVYSSDNYLLTLSELASSHNASTTSVQPITPQHRDIVYKRPH